MRVPVGVLLSGSGTNLQALIDACAAPGGPAHIALVISNRADAYGLERAQQAGIPTLCVPHRGRSRADFEAELVAAFTQAGVQWVCCAGFMRVLTPAFLDAFPNRVLNIHPALLPAFPGLDGQWQAHAAGVRIAGATVHLVDAGTDTWPILCQGAVPALPTDDRNALQQRILAMEHRRYPMALRWAVEGRIQLTGRQVHIDLRPGEALALWDAGG